MSQTAPSDPTTSAGDDGPALTPDPEGQQPTGSRWKAVALLAVIALGIGLSLFFPVADYAVRGIQWVNGLGPTAYGLVIGFYILACVLFLPASVITLLVGAAFGVIKGTIIVSIGSTLGAGAAFLLARNVFRGAVEARTRTRPRFQALDRAVGQEGFKIVFLTRLSPVFPFNMLNFAFGVTRVRFWHYLLASWIGMIPGTILYVYLGSLAGTVTAAAAGEVEGGLVQNVLFGVGLVATALVTIVITRLARRALKASIAEEADPKEGAQNA